MSYSLCGNIGANTGAIACDVRRGRPLGLVIGGASFTPTETLTPASFQAAFKTRIQRAAGQPDKLFPFPEIQGNTDQTQADKTGTLGYGLNFILLQGKPAYQFTMIAGTTQEKALRKFNNTTVPVFVFDDASRVWGVGDGTGNFFGAQCLVSVKGKGFDDGANAKATTVEISFINASDFYDNDFFAQTNFGIGDLTGLVDVVLSEISGHTSNVYHIQAKIATTELGVSLNPYDYFADALAVISMWKLTHLGAALTLTSVAKNTAAKGWDVTIDSTMFTAITGGDTILVGWTDPASLATGGILNSEVPNALSVIK